MSRRLTALVIRSEAFKDAGDSEKPAKASRPVPSMPPCANSASR